VAADSFRGCGCRRLVAFCCREHRARRRSPTRWGTRAHRSSAANTPGSSVSHRVETRTAYVMPWLVDFRSLDQPGATRLRLFPRAKAFSGTRSEVRPPNLGGHQQGKALSRIELRGMAREGIEPPTRGFSGRQRPIPPGLSRSISGRPATTYDRPMEHRASPRTLEYRGVQVLTRYRNLCRGAGYGGVAPRRDFSLRSRGPVEVRQRLRPHLRPDQTAAAATP
jgi:hypothetical protein